MYIVEVVGRGRESVSYSSHPVSLQVGPATIREDQLCLVLSGKKRNKNIIYFPERSIMHLTVPS